MFVCDFEMSMRASGTTVSVLVAVSATLVTVFEVCPEPVTVIAAETPVTTVCPVESNDAGAPVL